MATVLPIPIEFRIPDDWRPVAPDEVDAPGAAFVALIPHRGGPNGPGGGGPDRPGGGRADRPGGGRADRPGGGRADRPGGFTANVTIDGDTPPSGIALPVLADRSVRNLREVAAEVAVSDRAEVGSAAAPGLIQTVRLVTSVDGDDLRLVQVQAYLSMHDVHDPTKRAVIRLILTATPAQARAVLPDFQWFVSTVRPEVLPSDPH